MFTSVLGALTTAMPKYLLWGAYVPVLIFSFVNGGLIYVLSASGRAWLNQALATNSPLTVGTAFVFTASFAYVISSINDFLREILEGRYLVDKIPFLIKQQQGHRIALQDTYLKWLARRYDLQFVKPIWERRLREAADEGVALHPLPKDQAALQDALVVERSEHDSEAGQLLRNLRRGTEDPFNITLAEISSAVDAMDRALRARNKIADSALARDHKALLLLIETVYNTTLEREWAAALDLNMSFSGDRPAATQMGNIADAMFGYTMRRYGIDLNVLMSRLQTALLKTDDKSYAMMLDAKTQLDFVIACCFFTGFTSVTWAAVLVTLGGAPAAYLSLVIGGSLVAWLFYWLATQSYRSYSVTVRACVDVNRFTLLRALDLALPTTLNGELRLWKTLSEAAIAGSTIELSYEHSAK